MPGTIRDRLSRNAQAQLIGRDAELGELREALAVGTPVVFHIHGLPGIGKSALLAAFAEWSRGRADNGAGDRMRRHRAHRAGRSR